MSTSEPRQIGRYALYDEIAAGGMATVHLGRLLGPVGFSRTVAIKRLHPQFAKDPEFVAMFLDEARLAARIRHPNVVPTLDVVALDQELFLVMDYVQGESLARMVKAARKAETPPPLNVITTIMAGVLHGLHAAHEARTEQGEALHIVHRDVSPQNVLVGIDGVPRVLDFGVAKAAHRAQVTREGQVKGKIAYMPPEQIRSEPVDRRCDVFAASAVLWEAVTRRRLYQADTDAGLLALVLFEPTPSPRTVVPDLPAELERIIMRGLERDRDKRYPTAREMAVDLENCLPLASASTVGSWVERLAGDAIANRAKRISDIESATSQPVALPAAVIAAVAPAPVPVAPVPVVEPSRASRSGADEVSSATLSKVTPGVPARSNNSKLIAGIAAGLALLGVIAFFAIRAATQSASAGAEPPRGSASTEPPSAPPAASTAQAPAATASAASAEPSSAPTTAPRATGTPKRTPSPAAPAAPARPARPAGNCTPPYTVDSQGIRHMKPECL